MFCVEFPDAISIVDQSKLVLVSIAINFFIYMKGLVQ